MFDSVEFIRSAHEPDQLPRHMFPEIAFSGRSNVGKSSLINMLLGRKKVARISKTPGRTRSINFFRVDDRFCLVDLPGYGYARVSEEEKERWAYLIEDYLHHRRNLKGVIQIVDARREPTDDDHLMLDWLQSAGLKFIIAATKCDKLNRSQREPQRSMIAESFGVDSQEVVLTSARERDGRKPLRTFIKQTVQS